MECSRLGLILDQGQLMCLTSKRVFECLLMCWAVGVSLLGWIFKEFDSVWMREEISLESSLKAEALGVCTG